MGWEYCGSGVSQEDVACGSELSNQCHADSGNGECVDGVCKCSGGYFWYDCSRGCAAETTVTDTYGIIQSDYPSGNDTMHYLNYVNCTWTIAPDDASFDEIKIDIFYISLEATDTLYIYAVEDEDTMDSDHATSFSGSVPVEPFYVKSSKVQIQLISGSSTTYHGFKLEYSVHNVPLSKTAVALITASCVVVAAVLVALVIVLTNFKLRQRNARLEKERTAPAEYALPAELEIVNFDAEASLLHLKDSGFEVNQIELKFGLKDDPCPINEMVYDTITLTNCSNRNAKYCFKLPQYPYKIEFSMIPGQGKLNAHDSVDIQVAFKLLYTTHIKTNFRLEISNRDSTPWVSVTFGINLEGTLSDRLDPDDILLESVPIASGAFGSVFRGVYKAQLVAVKVLKHQEALLAVEKEDFIAECNLLRQIHHPYIASFVGASFIPGIPLF